jgi:hypothetical protein
MPSPLESDDIEIGEAKLVSGILGLNLDPEAVEPLEKSSGFRLQIVR